MAHEVGRRGLADPEADLERPLSIARGIGFAFELQCADQAGGAGELVQGEQAERVAHDDAHPGALSSVLSGVAQPPEHHREGGDAQVRLRLAAAGGEEEQVHGLAVRIERVREARHVQQDECELEGPPSGWVPVVELIAEALPERARHGPVRHPERIESILVRCEQRDSLLNPIRRVTGPVKQPLRGIPSLTSKGARRVAAFSNPAAVLVDEGLHRRRRGRSVSQCAKGLHRELDVGDVHRLGLLDRGARNPGRAQPPAGAVDDVPVRRHTVTGGELGRIRVVEIGDLLVPVHGLRVAQVGSGDEGPLALDLDLGLEGVCEVRVVLVRLAPIDQKDRDGAGSRGNTGDARGVDGPDLRVQPKTVAVGDEVVVCTCNGYRHRALVLPPLPDGRGLAVGILGRRRFVVRPSDCHDDRVRVLGDQEAQAHRRGEEPLLRGLALLRRLLRETGRLRHLVEVVVLVRVAALLGWRTGRDQEAGEVPVRGSHPSRQALGGEVMASAGADQVEVQGLDEAFANFAGSGGSVLVGGWDIGHGWEARSFIGDGPPYSTTDGGYSRTGPMSRRSVRGAAPWRN